MFYSIIRFKKLFLITPPYCDVNKVVTILLKVLQYLIVKSSKCEYKQTIKNIIDEINYLKSMLSHI